VAFLSLVTAAYSALVQATPCQASSSVRCPLLASTCRVTVCTCLVSKLPLLAPGGYLALGTTMSCCRAIAQRTW
jgi:hypothetical protein